MWGHLETVQLIVAASAAVGQEFTSDYATPAGLASAHGHWEVTGWLGAVAGWHPLQVAAGCQLRAGARQALRLGQLDPDRGVTAPHVSTPVQIRVAALATAADPAPWPGAAPCCAATATATATAALVCAATHPRGWSPARHALHHSGFRAAVCAVLLVAARLRQRSACPAAPAKRAAVVLPVLPPEIWLMVCGFARRGDWSPCLPAV